MSAYRTNPEAAHYGAMHQFGRKVLCALVACALTVVLLGEVGESAAQAAQRAAAEQSVKDHALS